MLAKNHDDYFVDTESINVKIAKINRDKQAEPLVTDVDITGGITSPSAELRQKRAKQILFGLILLSIVLFSL